MRLIHSIGDSASTSSTRTGFWCEPKDALAHNSLGNALTTKGDLVGAYAAYQRMLSLRREVVNS